MITLILYSIIMLFVGIYAGIFRHHSNLDEDFDHKGKDISFFINEQLKGASRMEIKMLLMAFIVITALISSFSTQNGMAAITSMLLMSPFMVSLAYSVTRELLGSDRLYKGPLSFNQNPITFRIVIKGYTVIDWLAVLYITLYVAGLALYLSWII